MSLGIHCYISEMLQFLGTTLTEVWKKSYLSNDTRDGRLPTQSPFEMHSMQVRLASHLSRHFVETLDRILGATGCIQGLAQTLLNCGAEIIKFPARYLLETERFRCVLICPLESLPMKLPRAVDSCGVAFGLEHARATVLHPHSCGTPCASSQQEDTYMPGRNVSGDVSV